MRSHQSWTLLATGLASAVPLIPIPAPGEPATVLRVSFDGTDRGLFAGPTGRNFSSAESSSFGSVIRTPAVIVLAPGGIAASVATDGVQHSLRAIGDGHGAAE